MASICLCFKVHQPYRLRNFTIFEDSNEYFDAAQNAGYCQKISNTCYLPANRLMLDLIHKHAGQLRISYSISGALLEQLCACVPEVLAGFRELAATGCVEFLVQPYEHSLSFLYSHEEFIDQVKTHKQIIHDLFGQTPRILCNTELLYHHQMASWVEQLGGFKVLLIDGAGSIPGSLDPGFIYRVPGCKKLKLLVKNNRLSDDVAFRFSDRTWNQWPLTAEKYACWIHDAGQRDSVINLVMNYETFGEHQRQDTGIFDFLRHLPQEILRFGDNEFKTPSEIAAAHDAVDVVDAPDFINRPDMEHDLFVWRGNPMQKNALSELYRLENTVKSTHDKAILSDWRKLQSAEHFYYMCTKWLGNSQVHKYAYPYESPYDLYVSFMNVLDHLELRSLNLLREKEKAVRRPQQPIQSIVALPNNANSMIPCTSEGNKR